MNNEMKSFLQVGVEQYANARKTIAAFEEEMGNLVEQAVKNRKQWHPLKGTRISKVSYDGSRGQNGHWVAIIINGESPSDEETKIDCGLWWNSPEIDEPIIYASFSDEPKRVVNFKWRDLQGDIRSFLKWERTYLYLPLKNPEAIAESLNRLLDALLKQLGT